jgi:TP901 family phage tail tape measure protein
MATTVGEAEIVIRANTGAFEGEVASLEKGGALENLSTKAEQAGNDAGKALSGGLSTATKDIGKETESALKSSTGRMEGIVNDFTGKAKTSLQGLGVPESLLSGPAVATVAFAAVAAGAVDLGAKMQSATARIAAMSGVSTKAASDIGNAFLTTAGTTEFSATEMANAYAQVAGQLKSTEGQALNSKQALDFMTSANDLATASGNDLNTTTSVLASTMQAFKIPAKGASDAANVLFNISKSTGQQLATVGQQLDMLKAKLGATAPPMADLGALMVDLTNNGITGRASMMVLNGAATALANTLGKQTATTKLAESTLAAYGLSATNAKGQLTPMSDIIAGLAPKYATMTKAQQLATSEAIFGTAAAKGMTQVINAGAAAYDKARAAVTAHNAVSAAAAKQDATLSGQLKILKTDVIDVGTQLGTLLVPAITDVAHASLDLITKVIDLVHWFEQGSAPAIAIAGVLTALVAPALINMGAQATIAAGKAVAGFVASGFAAMRDAGTTIAAMSEKTIAMTEFGNTVVAENAKIDASLGETQLQFEGFGATVLTTDTEIEGANAAAGASFTEMLGPIGAVAAAGVAAYAITTKLLDSLRNMATVKPTAKLGSGSLKVLQEAGLNANSSQVTSGLATGSMFDFLIKKHTAEVKAHDAALAASTSTAHAPDAYVAPVAASSSHQKKASSAAAKAAHAAQTAAKHAAAAQLKDENLLSSEVIKAITMPANQAAQYLSVLGVPVAKATALLHDSTLPLKTAVKALEDLGLPVQDAVKIAEAGQAHLTKVAAAAAKAAAKAKGSGSKNAIAKSFDALDEALLKELDLNLGKAGQEARRGQLNVLDNQFYQRKQGKGANAHEVGVHVSPGAVVVTIGDGHDAKSVKTHIDTAMQQLANELRRGISTQRVGHG